ncbi:MAG: crotonase/enoyl-CoA hydratase family protein, partial [Thiobacillus sp.]
MAHLQAVRSTLQPQHNSYTQLTTYFDPHSKIAWGYMHAEPRPCFTPTLLRELLAWGQGLVATIDEAGPQEVKYFV